MILLKGHFAYFQALLETIAGIERTVDSVVARCKDTESVRVCRVSLSEDKFSYFDSVKS